MAMALTQQSASLYYLTPRSTRGGCVGCLAIWSPTYLNKHGRPKHPLHLATHLCIGYSYTMTAETWRFKHKDGKSATVRRPAGPLRVNNGDAMMPALNCGNRPWHLARILCARCTCRRPAGATLAGLVSPTWRGLLGDTARWTPTKTGQSPRRFSGREAVAAQHARNDGSAREHAEGRSKAAWGVMPFPCDGVSRAGAS